MVPARASSSELLRCGTLSFFVCPSSGLGRERDLDTHITSAVTVLGQAPYLRALPVSLSLPLARLLTAGTAFAPGSLTFTPCPPPPRRQVGNAVQDTAEPAEGPGKGPTSSNPWKAPLEVEASVHKFSKVINTVDNPAFFTPNSNYNLKSYSLETASLVLLFEGSLSLAAQHRRTTRL